MLKQIKQLVQLAEAAKRVLYIVENDHSIKERDEAYAELRAEVATAEQNLKQLLKLVKVKVAAPPAPAKKA